MTEGQFQSIDVRGVNVRMIRGGKGPPLLFLHGLGQTGIWLPALGKLAQSYDVIAPDHPGFGQSDRPDWLEDMSDLVYHTLDLLDALELDRVNVIGASFGGWLAAELAVAHSERIGRLALSAAVGLRVDGAPITDLFALPIDETSEYLFMDAGQDQSLTAAQGDPDIAHELYRGQYTLARLAWNPLFCNPTLRRRLYRIGCPTLVLWGDGDRFVPRAHGEAYASEIPVAKLRTIENCGHEIHRERPDDFARAITQFFGA